MLKDKEIIYYEAVEDVSHDGDISWHVETQYGDRVLSLNMSEFINGDQFEEAKKTAEFIALSLSNRTMI